MDPWQQLGAVAPTDLTDARLTLHWAPQAILGAADALVRHAADDSHNNMRWLAAPGALVGHEVGRTGHQECVHSHSRSCRPRRSCNGR